MQTKSLQHVKVVGAPRAASSTEDREHANVIAVFSTFNEIDKHGDITLPEAFTDGASVPIGQWNHATVLSMPALPVGRGVIRVTNEEALLIGQINLRMAAGRELFEALRTLGEIAEWSYAFDVIDSGVRRVGGGTARVLKRVRVYEVCPVLVGAGVGTRTVEVAVDDPVKRAAQREYLRFLRLCLEIDMKEALTGGR